MKFYKHSAGDFVMRHKIIDNSLLKSRLWKITKPLRIAAKKIKDTFTSKTQGYFGSYLFRTVYIFLYCLPFVMFLWAELRYDVNMPNWDDYDSVLNWLVTFSQPGSFMNKLELLFRQHNEHRIVFDRLVELVELHALGVVNFIYLDFFGFLGLCLLVFIISYLGKRSGLSNWEIVPVPFFMLTFSQHELISFSMASIQVYWALLFSFISFMFVAKYFDIKNMFIGFLFSTIASFTSAGGLIGFPSVLIYYLINKKYRLAALWLFGTIIVFWAYFIFLPYNPTPIDIASHHYALTHPLQYLKYVTMFLGNMIHTSVGAFVLGILLLCTTCFLFLRKYIRFDSWIFIALTFLIATGAADGLSRISLGMNVSLSSRYTTFSALLIVSLYIAIASYQKNGKRRVMVTILGLMLSVVSYLLWFTSGILDLATTQGIMESQLVYPLQSRAYSILQDAMDKKIFFPIARIYSNLPSNLPLHSKCLYHKGYFGHVDFLSVTGGTLHIKGWAALQKQHIPAETVIINVDGKYYPSWYNIPRPDVAKYFNQNSYLYTGYKSTIALPANVHGMCHVSVIVVNLTRHRFYARYRFYESPVKTIHCN
jgi:hypothetical protein